MPRAIFLILLLLLSLGGQSQDKWKLRLDEQGIRVFTSELDTIQYRKVRIQMQVNGTIENFKKVFFDVNRHKSWVYKCDVSYLLRRISENELYYYSQLDVPWPASNRDMIVRILWKEDRKTGNVQIEGNGYPQFIPPKKDFVRIPLQIAEWNIRPVSAGKIQVEYQILVDPGGNVPAWILNLFIAKAPYETFRNLRKQVEAIR
jgi:START domain